MRTPKVCPGEQHPPVDDGDEEADGEAHGPSGPPGHGADGESEEGEHEAGGGHGELAVELQEVGLERLVRHVAVLLPQTGSARLRRRRSLSRRAAPGRMPRHALRDPKPRGKPEAPSSVTLCSFSRTCFSWSILLVPIAFQTSTELW